MLMTTLRLVMLRGYNVTLGRFGWGALLLRKLLLRMFVTGAADRPYMASARFFDFSQLDEAASDSDPVGALQGRRTS
jgi:hypothetical protein